MKALGWYFTHAGRRIWAATKEEARRLAKAVADDTGISVTVRPVKAKARPAARTMKRNPDPGSLIDVLLQQQRGRIARQQFLARTKPARLAKSDRRRGFSEASEAGRAKTGKFLVTAKNRREELKLYRPSRSQAERLASEFAAAGYAVTLKEV